MCPGDNLPRRQSAPETIRPGDNVPQRQSAPETMRPGDNLPQRLSTPGNSPPWTQSLCLMSKMAKICLFCLWGILSLGHVVARGRLSLGRIISGAHCLGAYCLRGILSPGRIVLGHIVSGHHVPTPLYWLKKISGSIFVEPKTFWDLKFFFIQNLSGPKSFLVPQYFGTKKI